MYAGSSGCVVLRSLLQAPANVDSTTLVCACLHAHAIVTFEVSCACDRVQMLPDAGLFDSIVGGLSASVGKPSKVIARLRGFSMGTPAGEVGGGTRTSSSSSSIRVASSSTSLSSSRRCLRRRCLRRRCFRRRCLRRRCLRRRCLRHRCYCCCNSPMNWDLRVDVSCIRGYGCACVCVRAS